MNKLDYFKFLDENYLSVFFPRHAPPRFIQELREKSIDMFGPENIMFMTNEELSIMAGEYLKAIKTEIVFDEAFKDYLREKNAK